MSDPRETADFLLWAAANEGRTVFPVKHQCEWTREEADACDALMKMAMAEAGHPVQSEWSESLGSYLIPLGTPEQVLDRARVLAYDRLGVEYEVRRG